MRAVGQREVVGPSEAVETAGAGTVDREQSTGVTEKGSRRLWAFKWSFLGGEDKGNST